MNQRVQFLGEGQNGIVLLVCPLDGTPLANSCVAVKITYSDPFIQEAKLAKKLEVLKPDTQAFVATLKTEQHLGIIPEWKDTLPKRKQTGEVIDWEKYKGKQLTYIYMEYSSHRMYRENPSAPGGIVFWEDLEKDEARKVFFILLHGLYVARKKLGFAHNDIHDGQIVLFQRNPSVPICLGDGYQIENCRFMPKFIDFGASVIDGDVSFTDDVMQLLVTFSLEAEFDLDDFDGIYDRHNYESIAELMEQFPEFRRGPKECKAMCIGCMGVATHIVRSSGFHVCSQKYCQVKLHIN